MRKVELLAVLMGGVVGILIRLYWPASWVTLKLGIFGLATMGIGFLFISVKATKAAYSSLERDDWTLAYVLRDAARLGVAPSAEWLVYVAKVFGVGFALVFGSLIGLVIIEALRAAR